MNIAKAFVHVPTREGFGLVVSEAMWQSTPVIGSSIGGLKQQIINGKTGYIVDPLDDTAIASYMERILENPEEVKYLGENAEKHVRANFLLPELIKHYFILLRYYTRIDKDLPNFRLNELTYNEVINVIRPRPTYL